VGQHVGVVAPRFFQRIGQDWQAVEGAISVDAGGQGDGGFGSPKRIEGDWPERVAEDAAEEAVPLLQPDDVPLVSFGVDQVRTDHPSTRLPTELFSRI